MNFELCGPGKRLPDGDATWEHARNLELAGQDSKSVKAITSPFRGFPYSVVWNKSGIIPVSWILRRKTSAAEFKRSGTEPTDRQRPVGRDPGTEDTWTRPYRAASLFRKWEQTIWQQKRTNQRQPDLHRQGILYHSSRSQRCFSSSGSSPT